MTDRGASIRRGLSSEAGEATAVSSAGHYFSQAGQPARDVLLTTMRDNNGNLRLINWEVNLNP